MKEIVFHGIGGQGAVTASEILAIAAGYEGKYSQSFPFFGVERRGAPVTSFCRIDDKQIRIHMRIYRPDMAVVLDANLLKKVDVCSSLKGERIIVVNSPTPVKCDGNAYNVDATSISIKHLGVPIVNTSILGAFARASGLVSLDSLEKAINEKFEGEVAKKNILAVRECFKGC